MMAWPRLALAAAAPAALVALIAGVVSYTHIADLALSAGQGWPAYLLPFAVDGLIVAGTVILLAGSLLGWLCVAPGIGATLYANVMSGLPHGGLAGAVAAWPAAAFALASFTLERWLRSRRVTPGVTPAGDMSPQDVPLDVPARPAVSKTVRARDILRDSPHLSNPAVAALVAAELGSCDVRTVKRARNGSG